MNKYEAYFGMCICLAAATLFTCMTFSCADDRRQIVAAIEAGSDSIGARCAIKGSSGTDCAVYMTLQGKKE